MLALHAGRRLMARGIGEEVDADRPLDLDLGGEPLVISAWGKKGSGKSHFNRRIYHSYPGDKLCLDVNGNAGPGPDAEKLALPLPGSWPETMTMPGERRRRRNLHFVACPTASTYRDDLDRAVGVALFPMEHRCMLWAGEVGELTPNSKSQPHMRAALMQNRHHHVDCLFDGPRPANVDPLVLGQSDLIAVFRLPNADDRERIAKQCGIPNRDFETECHEVWRRGKHWFLLWHVETETLFRCAPLPDDVEQAA